MTSHANNITKMSMTSNTLLRGAFWMHIHTAGIGGKSVIHRNDPQVISFDASSTYFSII